MQNQNDDTAQNDSMEVGFKNILGALFPDAEIKQVTLADMRKLVERQRLIEAAREVAEEAKPFEGSQPDDEFYSTREKILEVLQSEDYAAMSDDFARAVFISVRALSQPSTGETIYNVLKDTEDRGPYLVDRITEAVLEAKKAVEQETSKPEFNFSDSLYDDGDLIEMLVSNIRCEPENSQDPNSEHNVAEYHAIRYELLKRMRSVNSDPSL